VFRGAGPGTWALPVRTRIGPHTGGREARDYPAPRQSAKRVPHYRAGPLRRKYRPAGTGL